MNLFEFGGIRTFAYIITCATLGGCGHAPTSKQGHAPINGDGTNAPTSESPQATLADEGTFERHVAGRRVSLETFTWRRSGMGYQLNGQNETADGITEVELIYSSDYRLVGGKMRAVPRPAPATAPSTASTATPPNGAPASAISTQTPATTPQSDATIGSPLQAATVESAMLRLPNGLVKVEARVFGVGRTDEKLARTSERDIDWFIGGPLLSLLAPICGTTDREATTHTAFPDEILDISAGTPLTLANDTHRKLRVHTVRYASSGKQFWIACEGARVVGERPQKRIVDITTRKGDTSVATALTALPLPQ